MKKIILGFAFLGLLTLATPKVANANVQPCVAYKLTCNNGSQHYVVICDFYDAVVWGELLC